MFSGEHSADNEAQPDLPQGFGIVEITERVFDRPIATAVDQEGRIFVAQHGGRIYIVEDQATSKEPFLDLEDEVLIDGDRGLIGIVLDPDFEANGYVYLYYIVDFESTSDTPRLDAFGRVTRYTVDASNPNVADPASRHILIGETFSEGIPACFYSHNGGRLIFGSDGSLLVSTGDAAHFAKVDAGGLYPDCFGPDRFDTSEDIGAFRSQRIESLAGKILRIDPETGLGYSSNPFYTGDASDNASKVWAYGLRNPFRFSLANDGSIDPADGQPGTLYIADVGWTTWEELEPSYGGENFGWPCREGPAVLEQYEMASPSSNGCETMTQPTFPHYFWNHFNPDQSHPPGQTALALTAGDVFRGDTFPEPYRNSLFYTDYIRNWIGYARRSETGQLISHSVFGTGIGNVIDILYDPTSESFLLSDVFSGRVRRLALVGPVSNDPSPEGLPPQLSIERVYPNPSNNLVIVSWTTPNTDRISISIFDILGRRLYTSLVESRLSQNSKALNTRSLSAGVYRLEVSSESGQMATATFTVLR